MNLGAEVYMVPPSTVNDELLRSREKDYLAGRQVADVPGLQLRQESIAGFGQTATITTTVTDFVTVSYSPVTFAPAPSMFSDGSPAAEVTATAIATATSASRPWIVPLSAAARSRPSFFGLVLWLLSVLVLDIWMNGY